MLCLYLGLLCFARYDPHWKNDVETTSKQRRKYDVDPTSKNDFDTTSKLGRFRSRPDFDKVSTSKRRRVPAGDVPTEYLTLFSWFALLVNQCFDSKEFERCEIGTIFTSVDPLCYEQIINIYIYNQGLGPTVAIPLQ